MIGAQKKKHVTIDEDYTENLLFNLEKQKKEPCGGRQDVWDGKIQYDVLTKLPQTKMFVLFVPKLI